MSRQRFMLMWWCASCLLLSGCASQREDFKGTRPAGENVLSSTEMSRALIGRVDFERHVKPVLQQKCVMCHNSEALPGKMDLTSQLAARRARVLGVLIVPGSPERSLFLQRISDAAGHAAAMPPVGEQVTRQEMKLLERWIRQGAEWPPGPAGTLNPDA
jgi:uncharacterized membrane protein